MSTELILITYVIGNPEALLQLVEDNARYGSIEKFLKRMKGRYLSHLSKPNVSLRFYARETHYTATLVGVEWKLRQH